MKRLAKMRRIITTLLYICFLIGVLPVVAAQEGQGEILNESNRSLRSDSQIAENIRNRLRIHPGISEESIEVTVKNGTVTLKGTVHQYSDVGLAGTIANNVSGVTVVNNTLDVEPLESMISGKALADRVRDLIDRNPVLSKYKINVDVRGRSVTLEGTVDSLWKKEYATKEIRDISGILELDNEIAVVPTEKIGDERIAEKLQSAIEIETGAEAENVVITVEKGVVTLEGAVRSVEAEKDIADLARKTSGVKAVLNELRVDPYLEDIDKVEIAPDDSIIRSDIEQLFEHNTEINERNIQVTVDNGVVTLSGTVNSIVEKNEAITAAWSVTGVEDVKDRMSVSSGYLAEITLEQDVRAALSNRSSIDFSDIDVKAEDDKIILTGSTDSLWVKKNAGRVARSVIGVASVENLLTVVPKNHIEDEVIAGDVIASLKNNKMIDPENITVRVVNGVVELTGSVKSYDALKAAEKAVEIVSGVKKVEKMLDVSFFQE